jgi:ATP-binding cassette subfamily F protein 3
MASVAQTIVHADRSATDYVLDGHTALRDLQRQRVQADQDGASGEHIANLEMALEQAGAWQAQSKAQSLLAGLGFAPHEWDKPVNTFSGGWQMRIALARALMAPSELLLLDEPTNHLDLDAMIWLERWLGGYEGTAIIISHDSEFLDAVCTAILHIEQQQITRYKGNYTAFLSQRAERLRQAQVAMQRQAQETERLQQFIDRFKAKATKAKQAQSRVKALARMQTLAPLRVQSDIVLRIPDPANTPERLLTLKDASAGYVQSDGTNQPVLHQIDLRLQAGDRIGVLGVNGAGKSTLIKLIAGELAPLAGEYLPSKMLKVGYFAQHQMQMLDADATALQHMARIAPDGTEQIWRNYLAQFGFVGDRVHEVIAPFSGGEKARLALALVVWHKPNLLILDEPSNHLDAQTRESLTAALAEYEGSLLLVSHDRHLLRTTVDQFWLVAHGEVTLFDGDLDDYRQKISTLKSSRLGLSESSKTTTSSINTDRKQQRRVQAQARRQLAQLTKPLQTELDKLERQLKELDARLDVLHTQLASEQFYQDTDSDTRQAVIQEHGQLSQQKETLELECLTLMQEIEALEKTALGD